ncbi:MAG: hypothetical protein ABL993_05315 [Vicinamibacterales bacterium]
MTAQLQELLFLDGDLVGMASSPPLPDTHPRIVEDSSDGAVGDPRGINSSACWRRYIGTWRIADGRLYLVELVGRYTLVGEPIFAEWVTDLLKVPRGKVLKYVHMGFESVYEKEWLIDIVEGIVMDQWLEDNTPEA